MTPLVVFHFWLVTNLVWFLKQKNNKNKKQSITKRVGITKKFRCSPSGLDVVTIFTQIRKWFAPRSNIPWLKNYDRLGDWGLEKECCWWLTFWQSVRKPSSESSDLTLKMASAQVVETPVANSSPSWDPNHPDDNFQSRNFHTITPMWIRTDFKSFPRRHCSMEYRSTRLRANSPTNKLAYNLSTRLRRRVRFLT